MKPLLTLSLLSALASTALTGCVVMIGSTLTTESAKPPMHRHAGADHCEKAGPCEDCPDEDGGTEGKDSQGTPQDEPATAPKATVKPLDGDEPNEPQVEAAP